MSGAYGSGPMLKTECPHCGREISGGRVVDRRGYWIRLRQHRRVKAGRKMWCEGSRQEVEMKQ